MKPRKIVMTIFFGLVVVLGFYIYSIFNGTPWGKYQQKQEMLSYLDAKYQMDFSIKSMQYNGLGSGYYAKAAPKHNPELVFEVAVSHDSNSGYADLYPAVLWNSPEAKPIKEYILQLFPHLEQSSFIIDRQLSEDAGPHIPTYRSLHYDMGYQSVMIINLPEDWFLKTPEEQQIYMENIKKLATYLQSIHLPVLTRIFFQTEDYNNRKAIFITEKGEIVQK